MWKSNGRRISLNDIRINVASDQIEIEAFWKTLFGCYYNCDLELVLTVRLVNDIIATQAA